MADHESEAVRAVVWSELFPWLSLVRTFRLAVGFRVLVLSAAGLVITLVGWLVLAQVFQDGASNSAGSTPHRIATRLSEFVPEPTIGLPGLDVPPAARHDPLAPFVGVWARMTQPLLRVFRPGLGVGGVAYLVSSGLLGLAVWAFFGGAITRIIAVQLASEERLSWTAVLHHASCPVLVVRGEPGTHQPQA